MMVCPSVGPYDEKEATEKWIKELETMPQCEAVNESLGLAREWLKFKEKG